MSAERTGHAIPRRQLRKTIAAGTIGTVVEWYDYYLYGFAAAVVFNKLFFPELSGLTGTLAAFGVYAVGFFARPVGGIFFGRLGDRVGRRPVTVATVTITGLSTVAIGLLPTYATAGLLAPVLLTLMRLAQGFAAGAEWGGATLLTAESAPARRRAFYASLPTAGVAVSIVLAIGALQVLSSVLTPAQFLSWGWRIPFLASILLLVIGVFLRISVDESPEFTALQERQDISTRPIRDLLSKQRSTLLFALGTRIGEVSSAYILLTFFLAYLSSRNISSDTGMTTVLITAGLGVVAIPLYGLLSDLVGRRAVYMFGAIGVAVFAFPYFWLIDTRKTGLILVAELVSLCVFYFAISGAQPGLFAELFRTEFRFTGVALTRELTAAAFGGTAPFIATAMLIASGGRPWPIALYVMFTCGITIVALRGLASLEKSSTKTAVEQATAVPASARLIADGE